MKKYHELKFHRFTASAVSIVLVLAAMFSSAALRETVQPTARAATFTVTNTNNSGAGSLRQAIINANTSSLADTIDFNIPASDANCTAGGVCTITLTSGELTIDATDTAGTLAIVNATGARRLLISGNNQSRVFSLAAFSNLSLSGVTVTGGSTAQSGGGILSNGRLSLIDSVVSGNIAQGAGGGISSNATLVIEGSTISGNTANSGAGGISSGFSSATLRNVTISGNTGTVAGGMSIPAAQTGSSVSATFSSVTITDNHSTVNTTSSDCAGGVNYAEFSASLTTVRLVSTIVAGNTATGSNCSPDIRGRVNNSSFNLIGKSQGSFGLVNGTSNNQVGTVANPIDPRLASLADNGGNTPTHALLDGSPAIDKGTKPILSNPPTTDQRGAGFARTFDDPAIANAGDATDIGAFEVQQATTTPTPTPTATPTATPTPNTPTGSNVIVQSSSGDARVTFAQVTTTGTTTFTPINPPSSAGTPPQNYAVLDSAPAYDITTTAVYTPPVTVCFTVNSITTEADFARVRILHGENGQLVDRTILAPDSPAPDFATRQVCARVASLSPFVTALAPLSPSAAGVTIGGRVTDFYGQGISMARISITDSNGKIYIVATDSSGYYLFGEAEAGQTYIVSASRKRYQFTLPTQVLFASTDLTDVDFTALPFKRLKL